MTVQKATDPRVWTKPPKTLSAAIKRIDVLQQNLFWLKQDVESCREWGAENAEEARRLGRLLTYRAKVGDATAHCPHANTEIGKISGNTYCSDCQETLAEGKRAGQHSGDR